MMVVQVIENYENFGPSDPACFDEIQCNMDAALFLVAESGQQIDSEGWSKQIFKHQSDAVLFIKDLVAASYHFRITDKIYIQFISGWGFDHFNTLLDLARFLLDDDEELSQLMQDDDDLFPPSPWWM
ncbi:hypothetical protein [Burkholderia vietnamiensis]|uniref:hypothetical protein n=1 Tax=Burkholderia vietnamiensis TaxID=60552 RepID=UPI00158C4B37|nr:hypothetical protein [Burkholderia vietnamiensis]